MGHAFALTEDGMSSRRIQSTAGGGLAVLRMPALCVTNSRPKWPLLNKGTEDFADQGLDDCATVIIVARYLGEGVGKKGLAILPIYPMMEWGSLKDSTI